MKNIHLFRFFCVLACTGAFVSCKKDITSTESPQTLQQVAAKQTPKDDKSKRIYGSPVKMGSGVGRSWISVTAAGLPEEIGIEMTRNAVFRLPEDHDEASYLLTLPDIAKSITPFDHLVINWNEHGHAPFFYEQPHFDFHFYMMTVADRLAIPSYATNPTGFDNNPAAGYLPASYIAPPGGEEPQMGKHWVDYNAPELPWNGGALFTKSFIYGSYNGAVNFFEPMITMAYLQSTEASSAAFGQPTLFAKHTYYPTIYNVYRDGGNGDQKYNVTLSGFVLR